MKSGQKIWAGPSPPQIPKNSYFFCEAFLYHLNIIVTIQIDQNHIRNSVSFDNQTSNVDLLNCSIELIISPCSQTPKMGKHL